MISATTTAGRKPLVLFASNAVPIVVLLGVLLMLATEIQSLTQPLPAQRLHHHPVVTTAVSTLFPHSRLLGHSTTTTRSRLALSRRRTLLCFSAAPNAEDAEGATTTTDVVIDVEAKKEAIGNLVEDDEWAGLSMELGEIVKKAVIEDLKANAREFLGTDDYKLGDISKEVDARVKQSVAELRGKEEYEVGDLVLTLDAMSKNLTEELTGKPYETGDLSREIDKRVKRAVADYCGKEEYEVGDLSRAVAETVSKRVDELIGDYEFGDISREVERRRREWIKDFLGQEAAEDYKFGDISKKLATLYTGKDDYKFGDVTKKLMGDLFGGKKKGKDE